LIDAGNGTCFAAARLPNQEAEAVGRRAEREENDMVAIDWTDPRVIAGAIAVLAMAILGIVVAVRMQRDKTAKLRARFGRIAWEQPRERAERQAGARRSR